MASFIVGDLPVAEFDYDRPAAADFPDVVVTVTAADQVIPALDNGAGIVGSWDTLTLPAVGMYPIYVDVAIDGRSERTLVDYLVVCAAEYPWHNVITARLEWQGAPAADGTLARLLDVAKDQVEAYAPRMDNGTLFPERYRSAQLMQARNTFNASITNADNSIDAGGLVISVRPLDWAVKQLIRPQTAAKAFG